MLVITLTSLTKYSRGWCAAHADKVFHGLLTGWPGNKEAHRDTVSFFVELYYDPEANYIHRTRSFTSREFLMDYVAYVSLKDFGL